MITTRPPWEWRGEARRWERGAHGSQNTSEKSNLQYLGIFLKEVIGDGDDVGWTSPADASTPHGRHTGLRRVLRKDDPGADRKGGARYTAADAVCAERLRAGNGRPGGGHEDLRGGDLWDERRSQERVIADEFRRQMGVLQPVDVVSYDSPSGDDELRRGGVGSSVRPTR